MPFLVEQSGPRKGKFIGKANIQESKHLITFPSGARVEFAYMELDKDADLNWQGAQLTCVYWDELTHFTDYQFHYLRTRTRTRSKVQKGVYIKCSMNPDPDHFVKEWIEAFLDEDGYPIDEFAGRKRYFIYFDGQMFSSWDKASLEENFPGKKPLCYTFVPSRLSDNPLLLENNPDYEAILDANGKAEKAALLDGCWNYQLNDGSYFDRAWVPCVNKVPENATYARAWDKASAIPTDVNKHPDYTASGFMAKDAQGVYYLLGDAHPDVVDEKGITGRFRALPGDRDAIIQKQAEFDGAECKVVFSKDPGQAGDTEYFQSAKKLIEAGFEVRPDPMPNNKSKLTRFQPFSSACQNGMVRLVPSTWTSIAAMEHFLQELEKFTGEPSTPRRKDDFPDAVASCFNFLAREQVVDIRGLPKALSRMNIVNNNRDKLQSIMS